MLVGTDVCIRMVFGKLNWYEAGSKLFIDQGCTTLYRLLRYIGII